jgi:hypothetical protein
MRRMKRMKLTVVPLIFSTAPLLYRLAKIQAILRVMGIRSTAASTT